MSDFESGIEKRQQQSIVPINPSEKKDDEFLGEWNWEEYQQKIQEGAMKAKEYINEKLEQVNEKFKEISSKDPAELIEDAKEFARKKPGQAILISAAVGLVLGLILRGRK
ncbi:MAG: hypothetical protein N2Z23_04655 [Pyrinomonadaceae bacterium]|nr:hypothetical protein [Pyrinomonadaceae bacterium]MCX7639715.1 hypothetical protein [Pyrinomonadaceae bacterium]MDW8304298.1 hypothetical protein [Acidobacteriota bacterium]